MSELGKLLQVPEIVIPSADDSVDEGNALTPPSRSMSTLTPSEGTDAGIFTLAERGDGMSSVRSAVLSPLSTGTHAEASAHNNSIQASAASPDALSTRVSLPGPNHSKLDDSKHVEQKEKPEGNPTEKPKESATEDATGEPKESPVEDVIQKKKGASREPTQESKEESKATMGTPDKSDQQLQSSQTKEKVPIDSSPTKDGPGKGVTKNLLPHIPKSSQMKPPIPPGDMNITNLINKHHHKKKKSPKKQLHKKLRAVEELVKDLQTQIRDTYQTDPSSPYSNSTSASDGRSSTIDEE